MTCYQVLRVETSINLTNIYSEQVYCKFKLWIYFHSPRLHMFYSFRCKTSMRESSCCMQRTWSSLSQWKNRWEVSSTAKPISAKPLHNMLHSIGLPNLVSCWHFLYVQCKNRPFLSLHLVVLWIVNPVYSEDRIFFWYNYMTLMVLV